jgi:hypothetical protein
MIFDYAFIDFDNTIYESHLLVDHIRAVCVRHGVTEEDFRATLESGVHGKNGEYYNYTFELHIQLLVEIGYACDEKKMLQ